tara:strand:+ start:1144 stop:1941 length:798 start_codon:yes stop_codon:yes gene_type:complete
MKLVLKCLLLLLLVFNTVNGQKLNNPLLVELNKLIVNTKLYGGFYNGMSRDQATEEYESNKYNRYYNITFPGVKPKFSLQNDSRGWDGVGEGKLNQVIGPGNSLGDVNLIGQTGLSIIEVELFGKLYYTPSDGLIGVKLFSSEAGNISNYKQSLIGILNFLKTAGYSDQARDPNSNNGKKSSQVNKSHQQLINNEYTYENNFFNEGKSIDLVFTLTKGDLKIDVVSHDPSKSEGGQISIIIYNSKDFDYFEKLSGLNNEVVPDFN